ncbi:MAG: NFACT RNA binding domain-containing protein, partial [Synergistaceae bacterium]
SFFAKYKKIVSAQDRARILLEKVKNETAYLQEELMLAMRSDDSESITMIEDELGLAKHAPRRRTKQRNEVKLPPHKRFEFERSVVFAGLSAKGNRYVTFKYAAANDLWFHAQGIPGAHVVLRFKDTPDDAFMSEMVMFCASLAAHYSKSGEDENIRVDYTERRHVSPIKGSIANVTYREFKSIIGQSSFWEKYLSENHAALPAKSE